MTISRYYILFFCLGGFLLSVLFVGDTWLGEVLLVISLILISLMIYQLATSPLLPKYLVFKSKKACKTSRPRPALLRKNPPKKKGWPKRRLKVSQPRIEIGRIPRLPEVHSDELSHSQVKLSCAIIRAFMMHPYYRTYRILYHPPSHNKHDDITFRRRMLVQKDHQYYHDKALAYLVSCELEKKLGRISDPHARNMKEQAYLACRQIAMKLDPKNVNSISEKMYLKLVSQARPLSEHIYPLLLSLINRITASHNQLPRSVYEDEIIYWIEHLDKQIDFNGL